MLDMGMIKSFFINIFKRKGTKISPLAILHEVKYDSTTGLKAFCRLERSEVGKCTYIGSFSAAYDCKIGKFCSIARDVYIGGANHPINWISTSPCFHISDNPTGVTYFANVYKWNQETIIGNDVWIGVKSIILPGVVISDGAIIGAGSVVTKNVGPYEIWAGNPARFIRKRFDDKVITELLKLKWWNWDDEKIKRYGNQIPNVDAFIKLAQSHNKE